jgi:hypothetical protein
MNIRHKRTNCNVENVYAALSNATQKTYNPCEGAVNVADELKKMRETRFLPNKPTMEDMRVALGYKTPSGYQRYEDATVWQDRKFPAKFVRKLLKLWRGKGAPPIDSSEILRLADEDQFLLEEVPTPILLPGVRGNTISRELPLITAEQVEMFSSGALRKPHTENYVYGGEDSGSRAFRLIVTDRSMEPTFFEGDELTCETDISVEPGNYVIAKLDREEVASIRQYRLQGYDDQRRPIVDLVPANPNYPTVRLSADSPGRIFAVVKTFTRAVR